MTAFDFTKIRKDRNKRLGLRGGFSDPITWIDTGNFALNKMISGHFDRGVPLGAVTVFAGESGCLPGTAQVLARITHGEGTKVIVTEERPITVKELRDLWFSDDKPSTIQLETPDGFQKVISWFDKGKLPMVEVATSDRAFTHCARNHLIERADGSWAMAADLVAGDKVVTRFGIATVTFKGEAGVSECYDFEIDHPNHRYWGDDFSSHNSGKSYIVSGNIVRDALAQGIHVVLLDTENALYDSWMRALGVDTSHPNLTKEVVSTVDEVADVIREYTKFYVEANKDTPREQQPKVLFVVDSLGFVQSQAEIDQFDKNELKGDKGIKPKMLKMLVANCIRLFAGYELGLVATNHTYASQDMYSPDDKISGGGGFVYAASIVVSMNKAKLKEDEDGNKTKEVLGIRAKLKCVKTRFAKPFEEVEVHIPYSQGMSRYSGMFEFFEKTVLVKDGNKYRYTSKADGVEHKLFRKQMTPEFFDMIMREWLDDRNVPSEDAVSEHDEEIENVE